MAINDTQVYFAHNFNYQKVAINTSATVSVTNNTPNFDSFTIDHNLGYIPSCRVWYDPALGRRFPISLEQYTDDISFNSEVNQVDVKAYLTTTQLVIQLINASGSTKYVTYWARIYYDT